MGQGLGIVLLLALTVLADVTVKFRSSAEVMGSDILLSDIAEVQGDNADLVRELGALRVGHAALPGFAINIPTPHLRVAVFKPYYNQGRNIILDGARDVVVKTRSRTLYGVSLTEQIRSVLSGMLPWPTHKLQITFSSIPDELLIPDENYSLTLETASDCDFRGNEPMQAVLSHEGVEIKRFPFNVKIRLFETVCVAGQKLKRKAPLEPEDIRMETRDITEVRNKIFTSPLDLSGKILARTLLVGAILTDEVIDSPPLVKRGDKVRIISREKSAMVSIDGIARKDGRMGEKIPVRNSLNNRLTDAWVCGEGEVSLTWDNGGKL